MIEMKPYVQSLLLSFLSESENPGKANPGDTREARVFMAWKSKPKPKEGRKEGRGLSRLITDREGEGFVLGKC